MPTRNLNKVSSENEDTDIIVLLDKAVYLYPFLCPLF